MPVNIAAENVLGTVGAICWMGELIPQVWKSWREKSTEGLSHWLVLLWALGTPFLGVYAITQNLNIPLIVQPQLFGFFSLISWGQCQYYQKKRGRAVCIAMVAVMMAAIGGLQAGMVYAIKPSYKRGNTRPVQFFGITSSVILTVALIPQYFEIYKHHEVIGISLPFMAIDLLGGVFSDLSLIFKSKFDTIAGITYSLVIALDAIVIVAAIVLNPLARRRRRREAAHRQTETQELSEGIMISLQRLES